MFRGKPLSSVRFKIPPAGSFGTVLRTFNNLEYPVRNISFEQINFAILELLSNSLRAHREKAVEEPVLIEMYTNAERFLVRIIDRGGGFDPAKLPYQFDQDVESINLMSEAFTKYRETYDNSRFGMGFIATRRVFPGFKLYFYNKNLKPCQWPDKQLVGTIVELNIPFENPGQAELEEVAS